jgi:hypothetical protein
MALRAAMGWAQAPDGREASARAVRQALDQIGRQPVILAFVFASHEFPIDEVVSGAAAVLGEAPLFGLSAPAIFAGDELGRRGVSVALLAGEGLQAWASWWPGFGGDGQIAGVRLGEKIPSGTSAEDMALLLAGDGMGADIQGMCAALPEGSYAIGGGLGAGDLHRGRTGQIGGNHGGMGGLAAAVLSGAVRLGTGCAHGWQPVGAYFQVTLSQGPWVRAIDGRPASETFARLLGRGPRDWAFPPLNELVRLYPLGVERKNPESLQVRAPIRVEADGSLRMNARIAEGSTCHMMVGSIEACLQAARQAARDALADLGGARPVLALALTDVAWLGLMESQTGRELEVLQEELGEGVPLAGGYTLGQLARNPDSGEVELLNQHLEVVVIGESD